MRVSTSRAAITALALALPLASCAPAAGPHPEAMATREAAVADCTARVKTLIDGEEDFVSERLSPCVVEDASGQLRLEPSLLAQLPFAAPRPEAAPLGELGHLAFHRTGAYASPSVYFVAAWVRRDGFVRVVPLFDNGADYFSETEHNVRFVAPNGKIGFANEQLEVVIPAQLDWASPFEDGTAQVCRGCYFEVSREGYDADDHPRLVGGEWSTIDAQGALTGPWQPPD